MERIILPVILQIYWLRLIQRLLLMKILWLYLRIEARRIFSVLGRQVEAGHLDRKVVCCEDGYARVKGVVLVL